VVSCYRFLFLWYSFDWSSFKFASNMLKSSIGVEISITPTGNAAALSLGLGFLIPLLSSVVPIKSALSQ
jgi:hypothetical protein